MVDKSLFYSPNKLLSYNRILNFVLGQRGVGKSYGFKKFPINRFLKNGEQMIYLRRYKTELNKVQNYFDDVEKEFPDHHFKVKGRNMFIDGEQFGWAIPLSRWQSEKSNAYPNVTTIVFDEFLREKDTSSYLPNEVEALLNLMDTVFRNRDNVRCVCLANSVGMVNPYFTYFNIVPDVNKRYNAYRDVVVEIPENQDFSEMRRQTKFGSLIEGTEYGSMSMDNEFVNDSDVFISERTKKSRFQFSVTFRGMTMGIWVDVDLGLMYLCHDHDPDTKWHYAMSTDDLDENKLLMTTWKQNYHLMKLVKAFKSGFLRFDNPVLRENAYELFRKMNVQ